MACSLAWVSTSLWNQYLLIEHPYKQLTLQTWPAFSLQSFLLTHQFCPTVNLPVPPCFETETSPPPRAVTTACFLSCFRTYSHLPPFALSWYHQNFWPEQSPSNNCATAAGPAQQDVTKRSSPASEDLGLQKDSTEERSPARDPSTAAISP